MVEPAEPAVVRTPEPFDITTRTRFRVTVEQVLRDLARGAELEIDLSDTRTIDSAGLSSLLTIMRRAEELGIHLRLTGATPEVERLLRMI